MAVLIDSHCHLDFPDFSDELAEIVARAERAGVKRMVSICTRVEKFDQVLRVANMYESVYCSVGTHPHNAHEELHVTSDQLIDFTNHKKVVAIGEAGLDYFYQKDHAAAQASGLRTHIAAARKTGLPLVIHSRDADEDMAEILLDENEKGAFPFVLHCFSSGEKLAKIGVSLGGYVSFSGILTFKNSNELREIAADVPTDRLLVETDAPYLAPMPNRGKRNEPSYVVETAKVLSEVLNLEEERLWELTTDNFFRLFSKVSDPR